jgi:hypothetical protein
MVKIKKFRTLEEGLLIVQREAKYTPLSVAEIMHILSGKGRSLVLILLSLPFCQPIQIPGFSTPFGLCIAFLGLRMAFGKHAWLPQWLLKKNVPETTLETIIEKTLSVVKKVKPWIHPRFAWICHSPIMEVLNGIMIFALGIFLALPLPIPLSNLAAAWAIFLISLGTLEDDGLLVLIGYLIAILATVFFIGIAFTIKRFI